MAGMSYRKSTVEEVKDLYLSFQLCHSPELKLKVPCVSPLCPLSLSFYTYKTEIVICAYPLELFQGAMITGILCKLKSTISI